MAQIKQYIQIPDKALRQRALDKIDGLLSTEYLMVLAWRLDQADKKGFGSVMVDYHNGHPHQIRWTDSEKPHLLNGQDIEMMAQRWGDEDIAK